MTNGSRLRALNIEGLPLKEKSKVLHEAFESPHAVAEHVEDSKADGQMSYFKRHLLGGGRRGGGGGGGGGSNDKQKDNGKRNRGRTKKSGDDEQQQQNKPKKRWNPLNKGNKQGAAADSGAGDSTSSPDLV